MIRCIQLVPPQPLRLQVVFIINHLGLRAKNQQVSQGLVIIITYNNQRLSTQLVITEQGVVMKDLVFNSLRLMVLVLRSPLSGILSRNSSNK